MSKNTSGKKNGFTLIELLLGLTVTVAIFIIAASVVAQLLGSSTKSKHTQQLEQTKNDLQTDLGNSVKWADAISFINGDFTTDSTIYRLEDGRVYKGDSPLTPSDVIVTNFEVFKYTTAADATDLETGIGLTGQYYSGRNFNEPKFSQVDFDIDFNWSSESPNPLLDSNRFSIRWVGQVETPFDGRYTFYTQSDDGVRLWVDNNLVVDNWTDHGVTENRGGINLLANKRYDIRLEYYENWSDAVIRLLWSHRDIAKEIIPTSRLYPNSSASSIEIVVDMAHRDSSSLTDTMRLVLSPRGGTVGAIEPAPTPSPVPVPTQPPTPTPEPTPTQPPTPTPIPTPTLPPTLRPSPTITPTPVPTPTPSPTPKPLP